MAAEPHYKDEVQVIFTSVEKGSQDDFLDRRILLTKNNNKIDIGRSTKRDARLAARRNNAWFDSPVMSRNHARLTFSPQNDNISIMDIGSLHGTYVNNSRVAKNQTRQLSSGDILRFGTSVQKVLETFPPCEMRILLKHGTANPNERPLVFKVPDSSDEEDNVSDDDEAVGSSLAILLGAGMASLPRDQTATIHEIDLTGDDSSATKSDIPANRLSSDDEMSSDDKSDRVQNHSDWAPKLVDGPGTSSEAPTSPRHGSASIVIDADGEESLNDGDKDLFILGSESCAGSFQEQQEYDSSEVDLCQDVSAFSKPSDCTSRSNGLDDPDESYPEGDVDSLRASSEPKFISQTQTTEPDTIISRPGNANLDEASVPTISRPYVGTISRREVAAENRFTSHFGKAAKTAFLAAREHNRRVHASQMERFREAVQGASKDISGDDSSSASFQTRYPTSNSLRPSKSSTCTTTAALLASGEGLLPASTAFVAPAHSVCLDDLLDDSSSFAYEMSKKSVGGSAFETAISEIEETRSTHDDEVGSAQLLPLNNGVRRPRKRKSDAISVLLPTEVETGPSQTEPEPSQPTVNAEASPVMKSGCAQHNCPDPTNCQRRPFKRLRRAAEILGYATLGGVAVMSALIATAPAL
ncbi:hypothetical protein E4U42_000325 [Claviceps africana]|uniref:FHA domain-containing protein n=1 Tax=Claviceps africana TaxID=83212 RepID=A0A8K0JAF1_9HYPO|nr:hypothetical protein E4U42_000325 [Claviceps africana]